MRCGAVLLLTAVLGCGSVDAIPRSDGGSGGAAGAVSSFADGGGGAVVGSGGAAGAVLTATGGVSGAGGAAGAVSPATGGVSGAGGDAGAACLPYDTSGFAYHAGCDGGTTAPTSCHAACELAGAPFVGCVADPRVPAGAVVCHASCAECP